MPRSGRSPSKVVSCTFLLHELPAEGCLYNVRPAPYKQQVYINSNTFAKKMYTKKKRLGTFSALMYTSTTNTGRLSVRYVKGPPFLPGHDIFFLICLETTLGICFFIQQYCAYVHSLALKCKILKDNSMDNWTFIYLIYMSCSVSVRAAASIRRS